MKQENLEQLISQGFVIKGRQGYNNGESGYSASKETFFYGEQEGFVTSVNWNTKYTKLAYTGGIAGAAKYYIFNENTVNYFNKEGSRENSEIDFRLLVFEDVLYLWLDGVLSWRIPLTNVAFGEYEAGSQYQLGVAIGNETDGTAIFDDLQVKCGNEVNISDISRFSVKSSNVDKVDKVAGLVERTDNSKAQVMYFAGDDTDGRATQWEMTGQMYFGDNVPSNGSVLMGFVVGNGSKTVKFYGNNEGFQIDNAGTWDATYINRNNTGSAGAASQYVLNANAKQFFRWGNKEKKEVIFRALLADDILYVYLDEVLSWKIPLTHTHFGGFTAGTSYDFGIAFNGVDAGTAGFRNLKVKEGEEVMTNQDFYIRDPFILADDGMYYMYGTRFEDNQMDVFVSKDMISWEKQEPCFAKPDNCWGPTCMWAPEVFKYTNPDTSETAYYMFVTFRRPDDGSVNGRYLGTAILKAESPLGPFKEWSVNRDSATYGPVTDPTQSCLDGTLYIDDNGVPYMIYVREYTMRTENNQQIGEIYYVQLSNDLKQSVGKYTFMFDAKTILKDSGLSNVDNYTFYCTDGPEIYKASDGTLILLWSTFVKGSKDETNKPGLYLQLQVKSSNNQLANAQWIYDKNYSVLYGLENESDGGHGMLFKDFAGNDHLVLFTPNVYARTYGCQERSVIFDVTYDSVAKWIKFKEE